MCFFFNILSQIILKKGEFQSLFIKASSLCNVPVENKCCNFGPAGTVAKD